MEIKIGNDLANVISDTSIVEEVKGDDLSYVVSVAMDNPSLMVSELIIYTVDLVFMEPTEKDPETCKGILSLGTCGVKYVKYQFDFPSSVRLAPGLAERMATGSYYGSDREGYIQQTRVLEMGLYYDGEWVLDLMETVKKVEGYVVFS